MVKAQKIDYIRFKTSIKGNTMLKDYEVAYIRRIYKNPYDHDDTGNYHDWKNTQSGIAEAFNVSLSCISNIIRRKTFKNIKQGKYYAK